VGITLKNIGDVVKLRDGYIKEKDVRSVAVNTLVDTGAGTLANRDKVTCKVTEPVEIRWKIRETACMSLGIPGDSEILLGAIPLEDMELIVNPAKRELADVHVDEVMCLLK
jgi:hypothetical protein